MVETFRKAPIFFTLFVALFVAVAPAPGASVTQKTFNSPEDAVHGFIAAVRAKNSRELLAILGPGSQEIVSSGDPVADRGARERFLRLYDEKNAIERAGSGRAVLSVGKEEYPFPIPMVQRGKRWIFDAKAGKEELLNRRIGRNELAVVDVLRAYVDAQHQYAAMAPAGNVGEFAQRIRSTPGKKDGLYWQVREGEEESPFGPLLAKAAKEGYEAKEKTSPYHGYLFKMLKGQGGSAEGGAFNYVVNGRMLLGFALIAYPAHYGSTGVMSFIVNQNGIVYQKDLGRNTRKAAQAMTLYDPDKTWQKVEPPASVAGDATGK